MKVVTHWGQSATAQKFPRNFVDLFLRASKKTLHRTLVAMILAWVPTAVLAASGGLASLKWFAMDVAAQSRFFIVIPLLIVSEPVLVEWLEAITLHFVSENMIRKEDMPRFEAAFDFFKRNKNSYLAHIVLVGVAYAILASSMHLIYARTLLPWCYANNSEANLSLAGSWYVLVVLPMVVLLLFRWLWRQLLWTWLLHRIARMDLRLVPAHPDAVGGLSFVESCLWGYLPFGLALGAMVAGGLANRILYQAQSLTTYKYVPLLMIGAVLLICVGPLFAFVGTLARTKRRGIFEYGSLASKLGQQFESKWLSADHQVDADALQVGDFSATTDLYQVVSNIYQMNFVPVGIRTVCALIAATLLPCAPVALISVPFDVIMQNVIKLFL